MTPNPLDKWLVDIPDWMRIHLVSYYYRHSDPFLKCLNEYTHYLDALHQSFSRYLDTLHPTLGNAIRPMANTRRGDALHFEWAAFMVGYTLGLEDPEPLVRAGIGSVAGATYTIQQDKRIDNPQDSDWRTEACGNILLSKCVQEFQSVASDRPDFLEVVHDVFEELALAYFVEQADHRWKVKPYDGDADVQMIVGRSAPIKLCLWSLAVRAGREDAIPDLYRAVGHLIQAIQISDDLADWRDDYRNGYMSQVITRSLLRLGVGCGASHDDGKELPSEQELYVVLYTSGLLENLIIESNHHLESVLDIVSGYNPFPLSMFISRYMMANEIRAERLLTAKVGILAESM